MMPYKRPAADKSGVPVYQPNATTYQQLMQLQHQPFVPVSCEYSVSPTSAPATSCASPPAADPQTVVSATSNAQQQQQQQQLKTDDSVTSAAVAAAAAASVATSMASIADPAALAKEVAQQNYAKAVKMAQANQSFAAANHFSHLNPLNYTGVALNKQTLSMPPPGSAAAAMARYPHALQMATGMNSAGAPNMGINPYALTHANLLSMSRPPQTFINPYLLRQHYPNAATAAAAQAAAAAANQQQQLLAAQYHHQVSVAPTPITNVAPVNNIAAVAAQNNNNVVLPPYKKLKTT